VRSGVDDDGCGCGCGNESGKHSLISRITVYDSMIFQRLQSPFRTNLSIYTSSRRCGVKGEILYVMRVQSVRANIEVRPLKSDSIINISSLPFPIHFGQAGNIIK
jgi:hypothetical protein